jgi:hypothetical protein
MFVSKATNDQRAVSLSKKCGIVVVKFYQMLEWG